MHNSRKSNNSRKKSNLFYILILTFWFIDISEINISGEMFIHFLLCFYFLYLFEKQTICKTFFFNLLLCLESFILFGQHTPFLIYTIPASIITIYYKRIFNEKIYLAFGTITACIITHSIIAKVIFNLNILPRYLILKIFANIILILLLNYSQSTGRLGNRF